MQFETTVVKIQQQTPTVKSFTLDCGSQKFFFYAGQWVDIHRTIDDETHNCGYSITSIPSTDNTLEIAVKLAPELLLTKYLHEDCKVGDKLYISKAQGDIWLDGSIQGPYVFIAGGVGITPLFSMIKQILEAKPETQIVLLYSATRTEELLFSEAISQLGQDKANFHCYINITRENNHTHDFSGRISEKILKLANLPANARYYLCGPPSMVDTVAELLEKLQSDLRLDPKNIFYDKWWA